MDPHATARQNNETRDRNTEPAHACMIILLLANLVILSPRCLSLSISRCLVLCRNGNDRRDRGSALAHVVLKARYRRSAGQSRLGLMDGKDLRRRPTLAEQRSCRSRKSCLRHFRGSLSICDSQWVSVSTLLERINRNSHHLRGPICRGLLSSGKRKFVIRHC